MLVSPRGLLVVAISLFAADRAYGQARDFPPVPNSPQAPAPMPPRWDAPPPSYEPPGIDYSREAGVYGAASPEGIWFFNYEAQVLAPVFRNGLRSEITFNGVTDPITPRNAELDWTVSPVLQLGYRCPDDLGEVSLGYRFLATDGTTTLLVPGTAFGVRSRLDYNVADLDYATARHEAFPRLELQWRVGARVATTYYDTQVSNAFVNERATNHFAGGGVHGGLDLTRRIALIPGLGLFGRADGAIVIGQVNQNFSEVFRDANLNPIFSGETEQRRTQSVPMLSFQAGLSYTPPDADCMKFTLGYVWEQWYSVGRVGNSSGDIQTQGLFFRGQLDF